MKLLVTAFVTLILSFVFVITFKDEPGYVVLAQGGYTVRMTLASFSLLLVVGFGLLYLLFNTISASLRAPKAWQQWRLQQQRNTAHRNTVEGYARLFEGDWLKAEKKLLSHLPHNQSLLLNCVGAAYAAQQRGDLSQRDYYLNFAYKQNPNERLAINLTAARLHAQAGEFAKCRAVLEASRKLAPKNVAVVRLLADTYQQAQDWAALAGLLPVAQRLHAFSTQELQTREKQIHSRYLAAKALPEHPAQHPTEQYAALPKKTQKSPQVIAHYAQQLMLAGEAKLAEKVLSKAASRDWNAVLIDLYGKVELEAVDTQIAQVNAWAKRYGERPELSLCLARLYRRDSRLAEARKLYQKVVLGGQHELVYLELASLLEELEEPEAALSCYRQGVAAIQNDPPESEDRGDAKAATGSGAIPPLP